MKSWFLPAIFIPIVWGFWGLLPKLAVKYISPTHAMVYQTGGAVVFGIVLLVVGYFLVPILHDLFVCVFNTVVPISSEVAAEQGVATSAEGTIPISRIQFVVVIA